MGMATKPKTTITKPNELHLQLTAEQQKQLVAYLEKSGDARLDVSVTFSADVSRGVIAPATFLVGNAV